MKRLKRSVLLVGLGDEGEAGGGGGLKLVLRDPPQKSKR